MKLSDMIVSALDDLGSGADAQSIEFYTRLFTDYANDAVRLIAQKYKPSRKETVTLDSDDQFSIDTLDRECIKILDVRDESDKSITFTADPVGSGYFTCTTEDATVTVIYTYYPIKLTNTSDAPELPTFTHELIPKYIVARKRSGGDPNTQGTAAIHYQLFNSGLASVGNSFRGGTGSQTFINRW